ncbi:MAG TPA: alpha/beta hydrolase-fold protein [Geminicoccaceae bacterium]|nr:alpha/beta hydrolase-fold protein [Geminicoccaceae bacterium]
MLCDGSGSRPSVGHARGQLRHPKIRRLERMAPLERHHVDSFIGRNRFPLIERSAATFVYRGAADAVYLRRWLHGVTDGVPLERLDGSDLWHLRVPVPKGARLEYKFDVVRDGASAWINDPLNPEIATDPFGANSVCRAFGYVTPVWSEPNPSAPAGQIEELSLPSAAFGGERLVRAYLPAGFGKDRRYPLLIVHDGDDFVAHAGLATILDNLIHRGDIPPVIAALSQAHDRVAEYTGGSGHEDFVALDLLPALRARLPLREDPGGVVLIGASLGAVASLSTAWHAGMVGGLVLLSGSFIFDRRLLRARDPLFTKIADFVDRLRAEPRDLPRRIFVSCGVYEGLIGQNQALAGFLRQAGREVQFSEPRDAHHWQNWRDQMRAGLTWTLPESPPVGYQQDSPGEV